MTDRPAGAPPRTASPALFALEHAANLSAAPVQQGPRGASSAPTRVMDGNEGAQAQARGLQRLQGGVAAHIRVTEDLVRWRESTGLELERSVEGLIRDVGDLRSSGSTPSPVLDLDEDLDEQWRARVDSQLRTLAVVAVVVVAAVVVSHVALGGALLAVLVAG